MSPSRRPRFEKTKLISFFSKKGGVLESRAAILLVCRVAGSTQGAVVEEGLAGARSGSTEVRMGPVLAARWTQNPRLKALGLVNSSLISGSGQQKSSRPPLAVERGFLLQGQVRIGSGSHDAFR